MPFQENTPSKYRMTFRDAAGVEESHYVAMVPDPGDAEKVKAQLIKTRSDLYLRGVNEANLTVVKVGPQSAADMARVAGTMNGIPRPVTK